MAININKNSPFSGNQSYDTKTDKNVTNLKNKAGEEFMGFPNELTGDVRYFGSYIFVTEEFTFKSTARDIINTGKVAVTFTVGFTGGQPLPTGQSFVFRIFREGGNINTTSCVFLNSTGTIPASQKIVNNVAHAQAKTLATPVDITFPNLLQKADRDHPYSLEARLLDNTTGEFISTQPLKIFNLDWE